VHTLGLVVNRIYIWRYIQTLWHHTDANTGVAQCASVEWCSCRLWFINFCRKVLIHSP